MSVRRSSKKPRKRNILPEGVLAFTPRQLLGTLPLGRHAIYALARAIGVRCGRRLLISREALEAWLRGREKARAQ